MKQKKDLSILARVVDTLTGAGRVAAVLLVMLFSMTAQTAWADPENVVTQANFSNFFDANGVLKDAVEYDELIFQGEFTNANLSYITIDRSITINGDKENTGDKAVLNKMGLRITGDDVTVTGFTLNEDGADFTTNDGAAIYVSGSDVTLDGVSVTYNAPDEVEAKAIFANSAANFKLINSEITFTGANPGSDHYRGLEVSNSNNAEIDNNTISAEFPAVPVDWYGEGIAQDLVLAVGIQGGKDVEFTNNTVIVNTNGSIGSYPTIDAVMIHSTNDILIKGNTITHLDTTAEDGARYYYSLDIYSTTGTVEANDITVNTTTDDDDDRAGTAYPVQLAGPFTVTVKDNKLTGISKGPITAIWTTNWAGAANLTAKNNIIDVTGYATTGNYALVTGIEAEIDVLEASNNTISVANVADYDDANQVFGISMTSSYMIGEPIADIKDNNMTVDGKYAVYYAKAKNTNVIGNALYAHELTGDDAVYIGDGDNNTVASNIPLTANEANSSYWTTFYCSNASYLIDEDENATAYTAEVSGETITLYSLGKDVPKNTAVIIKGEDDEISMTKCEDPDLEIPANDLDGVDVQTATSSLGDGTFYVLGKTTVGTEEHFGFHKYTGTTMPARKAFLLISGGDSSNFFGIDDETTGIHSVDGLPFTVDSFFDLNGRKVTNPTKGIYIHNGKKIVFNR
ncbi:MAG: hypothetical protein IKZ62_04075 [Prevotella sp.]|nr:hypothetical protein [Prevotella sp.]